MFLNPSHRPVEYPSIFSENAGGVASIASSPGNGVLHLGWRASRDGETLKLRAQGIQSLDEAAITRAARPSRWCWTGACFGHPQGTAPTRSMRWLKPAARVDCLAHSWRSTNAAARSSFAIPAATTSPPAQQGVPSAPSLAVNRGGEVLSLFERDQPSTSTSLQCAPSACHCFDGPRLGQLASGCLSVVWSADG